MFLRAGVDEVFRCVARRLVGGLIFLGARPSPKRRGLPRDRSRSCSPLRCQQV